MSKVVTGARFLLGVAFLIFGLNGFLHFFNPPPPTDPRALAAITNYAFILPVAAAVELLSAALLLYRRTAAIGTALIAPVLVNIVAFHLFLDMKGIGLGGFLFAIDLFLFYGYREQFMALLLPAAPSAGVSATPSMAVAPK